MRWQAPPEHTPQGDPCLKCGLPERQHRKRQRNRITYFKNYNAKRERLGCVAVDGEGVTLPNGEHIYVYMAASNAERDLGEIRNPNGLKTYEIFDFLVSLPQDALKVGYGLGYDKTLWVKDLPDESIWLLARPEYRQTVNSKTLRPGNPKPIEWGDYLINSIHKRFTVRKGKRSCTVWDFLGFFQRSFVRSLTDWEIGTKEELNRIQAMKDQRGDFANLSSEQIEAYCKSECRLMAKLADTLLQAHRDAELTLRSYYGAGSTASVLLDRYDGRNQKADIPDDMQDPVQRAFFGGRFEISRIGPIPGTIHQYDIASAYPHAMSLLPCFICGKWKKRNKPRQREIEQSQAALIRYRLPAIFDNSIHAVASAYGIEPASSKPWGPLPFRRTDGNIIYPQTGMGWVWRDEFLAAQRFSPHIQALESWLYHTDCECGAPFAQFESEFQKRIAWGKSGKGQVLKLGLNSCYGKRAQNTGAQTYRCMVSAGMITSQTRARLLDAINTLSDRANILSVATDGLLTREPLPIQTAEKILGCWEHSVMSKGVFMLRPGFEFSLALENTKSVKARGAGKNVVIAQRQEILEQWQKSPGSVFTLGGRTLFRGMKTSVRRNTTGFIREDYARWVSRPMDISYVPTPKRPFADTDWSLHTWAIEDKEDSAPYARGTTPLIEALREMRQIENEQPDSISEEF